MKFSELEISKNPLEWGPFGDFMAGTLNPVFAFLSLLALLTTIKLQNRELHNSTQELKETKVEMARSASALIIQSESIKLQNFENTFFKMLDLHNDIVKNLVLTHFPLVANVSGQSIYYKICGMETRIKDDKDYHSRKVIAQLLKIFKSFMHYHPYNSVYPYNESYKKFHEEYQQIISHYFRNIYQLLKFIHKNEDVDRKFYSNILRAQFSNAELELLFYNCASELGEEKCLPLLIEYEFLEHLTYHSHIKHEAIMKCIIRTRELDLSYPDNKLFGKDSKWESIIYVDKRMEKLFEEAGLPLIS